MQMLDLGPFSVDPSQVAGLTGAAFAEFVGRLLAAELALAGMSGSALAITYRENAADGGVDATLTQSFDTGWIPAGDSAWQFKAGDLGPAACATELTGATAALDVLRTGGVYRLVLGKSLTPAQLKDRKDKLEDTARSLGIEVDAHTINVLNGDALARWAERFPAVASSPSIRGMGIIGQTFGEWSNSVTHKTMWVTSKAREDQMQELREAIQIGDETGVHVEGASGLGKTRLVMEALRGQLNESIVVYVPSEDQLAPSVLSYLQTQSRAAVVVIDECDAKRHDVFAAMLQTGSKIRLVTISETSSSSTRSPVLLLSSFDDQSLSELLQKNEPTLWPEATRVIVEVAAGNIDYALKCAKALIAQRTGTARQMVTPEDIRQFIANELPGGSLFLASCALALLSRIGFDGDLAQELSTLGDSLGISESDLRAAASELKNKGLLTTQGRYRSVGPHPVAIYLASSAWAEFGPRILDDVLPRLSDDMTDRLFRRATDVGDSSLPREVIDRMLGPEGVLASLESLATDRRGRMLDHFAILAPERVSARVAELLVCADDEDIRRIDSARRPLVGALQKLVWHSGTFTEAADSILRLALAETEAYANNSTGVWIELFGSVLPATAASPDARLAYLRQKAASNDPRIRMLVIEAGNRALDTHESTVVSGELQGGVVVEPRGGAATWSAVWEYRNRVIDMLRTLADDSDHAVAEAAINALTRAIHGTLDEELVREHLTASLTSLPRDSLRPARAELYSLRGLFERNGDERGQAETLDAMLAAFPAEEPTDILWRVTHAPAWDRLNSDIEGDILDALKGIPAAEATILLSETLADAVPTDFSVGAAIARLGVPSDEIVRTLVVNQLEGPNRRALTGYLVRREEQQAGSYDEFVDQLLADKLAKLSLTTQGPRTKRAEERLIGILPSISVAEGARAVFYWLRHIDEEQLLNEYINGWTDRVANQEDYNALIDFLAFELHDRAEVSETLENAVAHLVAMRAEFQEVGQQEHDWIKLGKRQLNRDPNQLVWTLVDLVEVDALSMYSASGEKQMLQDAVQLAGPATWVKLMDRIATRDSWKLAFATRGWLANAVDIASLREWVGDSGDRARVVASVASVGGEQLTPVAAFLLDNFGDVEGVTNPLVGDLISGMWTGNESDRIKNQIDQVKGWRREHAQSGAVKRWCRGVIELLESRLMRVQQREQEGDW